jgi:HlyD family secretion protein
MNKIKEFINRFRNLFLNLSRKVKIIIFAVIGLLLIVIVLVSLGGKKEASPEVDLTAIPIVEETYAVIAEGRIVPKQYVFLTFTNGGIVDEVLVQEGEKVEKGQPLARLSDETLVSALAAAELELVQARQSFDDLNRNQSLLTAQAQEQLAEAQDSVRDAENRVNNLVYGAKEANLQAAEANVIILRDRLEDAEEDFDKHANKPPDNLERAAYQAAYAQAQLDYDVAVNQLNNMQAGSNPVDMAIAEAELAVAEANLAIAERDYDLWLKGPHPDDLEAAQARLDAAESGVEAAQAAVDDAELKAPFDGVVASVDLREGELVNAGQTAVVVADFSVWMVETDNLTEIEVPRVYVGQPVEVVADALPDITLTGEVESIRQLYEEKRGDITYTVKISLDEGNPDLRWGMTVVVNFLEE